MSASSSWTSAASSVTPLPTLSSNGGSTTSSNNPMPTQGAGFSGFPMPNITIVIDGTKYYPPLPGQDPLTIILSDSTTAKITNLAIERNGVLLPFPSYQELKQNGDSNQQLSSWSVQFSTRKFQPPSCLLDVITCFQQAEAAFTSAAGSLGDSLASIGASIMQAGIADAAAAAGYASEASSYSIGASSLIDGMSSTLGSLEGAAEALDGAMQAVNENLASFTSIELQELSAAGTTFSSYPEISVARGMLSNLSNIMKIAWANSPAVVQNLWSLCQAQWLPITSSGALVTSVWGLHQIGKGATTTETDKPVEERLHFILFEQGFSINVFNVWTFSLDQNKGTKTAADPSVNDDLKRRGLPPAYGPGYTTKISIPKATLIRLMPVVRVVYLHPLLEERKLLSRFLNAFEGKQSRTARQGRASFPMGSAASQKRDFMEGLAQMNLAAFSHHRGMPPNGLFTRDTSGGAGVTIFVPDSGAEIDGPAWQIEMRDPEWYVVPNELTLPNVIPEFQAGEDMTD
ncbi:hypothetical protein Daus18300_009980 [Diaporthe australafricana]|uniref:Uncharacterized protein n=1 Tax=Diaporthe australafricana TaxID=127596 RepID=A0ABR3WCF1_9PEZI